MDKVEKITDTDAEYVKRMMDRRREHNRSFERYSKSLRRRLSILEAINQNMNLTSPTTDVQYEGNPFEREFANTSGITEEIERQQTRNKEISSSISYVVGTEVASSADDLLSSQRTYSVESSIDKNTQQPGDDREASCQSEFSNSDNESSDEKCNSIEYDSSRQFQREMIEEASEKKKTADNNGYVQFKDIYTQPRLSMGEYFRSSTRKDLSMQDFVNESRSFDEEFECGNAELQLQGADVFFGARVLEILEPEVVNVERKSSVGPMTSAAARRRASDMAMIQDNLREMQLQEESPEINDSTSMSFGSEDIRDIDREIDKLQLELGVLDYEEQKSPPVIGETPKSKIYPSLDLVRRMSDNFTPKKLFHTSPTEKPVETTDLDINFNTSKGSFEDQPKPSSPPECDVMMYRSPMAIPTSHSNDAEYSNVQRYEDQHETSEVSFIKRNTSFLMNKLHLPKFGRRKPNLESTRKIFSSGGKTLSPTSQMGSMISTLTLPNTPSGPPTADFTNAAQQSQQLQQVYRHNGQRRNIDGTLPYEVENFLEAALGDEHLNSSFCTFSYSDMRDTNSHINASELISEVATPTKNRKVKRIPNTEPSNNRSKLNRTLTIYKTLTQRIKEKFRGSVKDPQPLNQSQDLLPNINPNDLKDNVKKLLAEVDIQQTVIYQASKALELCNSMRAFIASPERVESERLLMLAKLRKKAAQDEISRLTSQSVDNGLYCERGEITIKELSLQLREEVLRRERQGGDVIEWLVCVVSEGATVWATQAVECPTTSPRLYFPGELSLPGLPPDFRLTVTVYSLKMPKQLMFNHEDKYRIQKSSEARRSLTCPSPQTLLMRSEKRRTLTSPKQHEIRFSGIQETSFVVSGSVDLMLHDLNLKSPWPLSGILPNSVLHGTIDLSLSCRLELSVFHTGFLTHGDEAGGLTAWNRRWCVLKGHNLLFWNYPREQECKPPLYSIDLVKCVSRRIGLIDRSLCAKPRTLLIETSRSRNAIDRDSIFVECRSTCTVVRHLLSCDTYQDLMEWQSKLNHVASALREWSIIACEKF
ncbi:uncharacterized protein LOC100117378 [Nasonia vitripennis]|uniref:PH domain-containing protein n=1 Tax=Nasonia vitripennis TaxID=7425 RepID=A0A7M7G3D9_NASVI|nr:uncharacterized protein LOC100117378 [Nasonia vitripennis]